MILFWEFSCCDTIPDRLKLPASKKVDVCVGLSQALSKCNDKSYHLIIVAVGNQIDKAMAGIQAIRGKDCKKPIVLMLPRPVENRWMDAMISGANEVLPLDLSNGLFAMAMEALLSSPLEHPKIEEREYKPASIDPYEMERLYGKKMRDLQKTINQLMRTTDELQKSKKDLGRAQDQLLASQRLSALGEMSAALAHELRQPLTAMKNVNYTLKSIAHKDDSVSREQKNKCLAMLSKELFRSEVTINELLHFARDAKPNYRKVKLGQLITDILSSLERPEEVKIRRQFPSTDPPMMVDPELISISLSNILRNAVQAVNKEGAITIAIEHKKEVASVSVTDTGPGIDPEKLDVIFDPLKSEKAQGTGLGLSVSRKLVGAHKGTLVAVEHSGGARFIITLPKNTI